MGSGWNAAVLPTALAAVTLALFGTRALRADGVAVLALAVAVAIGVVPLDRALSGFADPVIITLGALTILASAVHRSGLVDAPRAALVRRWRSTTPVLLGSGVLIALLAAFSGRAGTRAAIRRAARLDAMPSNARPALLLDLACCLGGLLTVVGGVPNLLVSAVRANLLGAPFDVLAFSPVGVVLLGAGLICFVPLSLVTNRRTGREVEGPADELRRVQSFTVEIILPADFALAGRPIALFEAAGEHAFRVLALVREGFRRIEARPDWPLEPGDVLILDCQPADLHRLTERFGLQPVDGSFARLADLSGIAAVEAVVTQSSDLVGRPPSAALSAAGVHLLGVGRNDVHPPGRLRRTRLRAGDILLLAAEVETVAPTLAALGCVLLAERRLRLRRRHLVALPLLLLLFAILAALLTTLPLWLTLLLGVLCLVLSGLVTLAEAYETVPWPGLVMLACLLPLAGSLHASAASAAAAQWLAPLAAASPGLAITATLAAGIVAALLFGAAVAVLLLAPFGVALAAAAGLRADALLMAVAVGASLDLLGGRSPTAAMIPALGRRSFPSWPVGVAAATLLLICGSLAIDWAWSP